MKDMADVEEEDGIVMVVCTLVNRNEWVPVGRNAAWAIVGF